MEEDCSECRMGEYGDIEGATSCKPCPEGHSSVVGSKNYSDCEVRVIIQPTKIPVDLTPDDQLPKTESLILINTGVKELSWSGSWASGAEPEWAKLVGKKGNVVAGNLSSIDVELSFPRSLADTLFANALNKTAFVQGGKVKVDGVERAVKWIGKSTDGSKTITSVDDKIGGKVSLSDGTAFENPANRANGDPVRQELIISAGSNKSVTVELRTRPGNFSASMSTVEDNSEEGSVSVGERARYTVTTRDKYSQARLKSAPEGLLQLRVIQSRLGSQICTANCTTDTSTCPSCCCYDSEDGKFLVSFEPEIAGNYTIEVLTSKDQQPLRFVNGETSGILMVPRETRASLCMDAKVTPYSNASTPVNDLSTVHDLSTVRITDKSMLHLTLGSGDATQAHVRMTPLQVLLHARLYVQQ